jgi:hypothetical protein
MHTHTWLPLLRMQVNCDGTRVSFFGMVGHGLEPSIWVWNVENNTLSSHSFDLAGLIPVSHFWDGGEPRLFAVESNPVGQGPGLKKEVSTFFSSAEEGIVVQHKYRFGRNENTLSGIDVPHLFYGRLAPTVDGYVLVSAQQRYGSTGDDLPSI